MGLSSIQSPDWLTLTIGFSYIQYVIVPNVWGLSESNHIRSGNSRLTHDCNGIQKGSRINRKPWCLHGFTIISSGFPVTFPGFPCKLSSLFIYFFEKMPANKTNCLMSGQQKTVLLTQPRPDAQIWQPAQPVPVRSRYQQLAWFKCGSKRANNLRNTAAKIC